MAEETKSSQNPKPPPIATVPATARGGDRDFLLHLEAYLARRDGVDKLLKISRYAAKIILSTSVPSKALVPHLKAFESSVGLSRKAFRLGKFVQDVNAFRSAAAAGCPPSSVDFFLAAVAYGGEGLYYFVEQFVWLSKAGLIPSQHSRRFQKISAWAELLGYLGSISLKAKELRKIRFLLESKVRSTNSSEDDEEIRKLRVKLLLKELSIVQDLADGLMALGDVSDGKGFLSNPLLMASAGLLSALISTHKNWASC